MRDRGQAHLRPQIRAARVSAFCQRRAFSPTLGGEVQNKAGMFFGIRRILLLSPRPRLPGVELGGGGRNRLGALSEPQAPGAPPIPAPLRSAQGAKLECAALSIAWKVRLRHAPEIGPEPGRGLPAGTRATCLSIFRAGPAAALAERPSRRPCPETILECSTKSYAYGSKDLSRTGILSNCRRSPEAGSTPAGIGSCWMPWGRFAPRRSAVARFKLGQLGQAQRNPRAEREFFAASRLILERSAAIAEWRFTVVDWRLRAPAVDPGAGSESEEQWCGQCGAFWLRYLWWGRPRC